MLSLLGGFYFGFDRLDLPVEGFKHDIPEEYHDKRMPVNEKLTFNFKSKVVERLEDLFTKKRIQIEDYVIFEYNEDTPFRQLMLDALTFRQFLEFTYGQRLPFQLRLIFPDADTIKAKRGNRLINNELEKSGLVVTNFSLNSAIEIPMGTLNRNKMLLSRWTISEGDLSAIVQRWFKQPQLKNTVEYYLETFDEYGGESLALTNVMINNRFLNLIQGLEDYYRKVLEPPTEKKRSGNV